MSSNFTCCGCWPTFIRSVQTTARPGRTYRRAKYNEREYSIEFENLIEEEDFYPPSQHIVTEVERDLLSKGKFADLLQHESDIGYQLDAKLKEKEEDARLEDEAYIQAKREASRVAKQAIRKKVSDKSNFPNTKKFDSDEFSKWLSEEKIDITSPELDVEDFESFLEKVRAKSAQALEEAGKKKDATAFEQTLTQGLAATKIAGDALNALQPVELHAVGMPLFNENSPQERNVSQQDRSLDSHSVIPRTDSPLSLNPPTIHSDMTGGQLINISPDTNTDISATPSTDSVDNTSVVMSSIPATSSEIDVQPVIQPHDVAVENSSETLSNTSAANVSNDKLVDVSPIDDNPQLLAAGQLQTKVPQEEQVPLSFENPSFDEPSILSKESLINPIEELPAARIEQEEVESNKTISDIQIENESDSLVAMTTVVTINTPRNMATNLNPVENNIIHSSTILTNETEVQSVKTETPSANQDTTKESTFNSDDDFYDFDDDEFENSNSNGAFEDYLA